MSKPVEAVTGLQATEVKVLEDEQAVSSTPAAGENNNGLYGTSKYMFPVENAKFVAEAELYDFAPTPCVCCGWTINDKVRKRTYFRVYENRVEYNWPIAPFCCLTKERCIRDSTAIMYFDKQPSRSGMCCGFIPATCCGPPVLYNKVPKICGVIDLRPCYGETIYAAPCDCLGLKSCCGCCGAPCYQSCACPMVMPVKNGEAFLAKWKGALDAYWEKNGLDRSQMARFTRVADGFCNFDNQQEIEAVRMER